MDRSEFVVTAEPVTLRGTCASPGFARGPAYVLDDRGDVALGSGTQPAIAADREHAERILRSALDTAKRQLAALMARAGTDAERELLEFQIAMLDDDAFVQAPFDAIAAGADANAAWVTALDEQAADYRAAGDAYFAARAVDLVDMRDRVSRCLVGAATPPIPPGSIVVAADLAPSRFLETAWSGGGIALYGGSTHSHVATLARARGVPMIVAMASAPPLPPGELLLDADAGLLIGAPDVATLQRFTSRQDDALALRSAHSSFLAAPARTSNGERVRVLLNVAGFDDLAAVNVEHCDGIGLVRTELMLRTLADLRDEEGQLAQYRAIVHWAAGRPVTFRTLDAGGDKPIDGYTLAAESNPFLGVRGVRLSLLQPDILLVQLRALARAAADGDVRVMIPMVTVPDELDRVRALLGIALSDLRARDVRCAEPRLGMMVEVPAAALTLDTFAADFFSIGSNDLIAYLTAASRDCAPLAQLGDPLAPAVLRLLRTIVMTAHALGCDLSVCGDMASDFELLPALLASGVRSISIAPAVLASVKAAIATFSARDVG